MMDYISHLVITGFCWKCGKYIPGKKFCNNKCENLYEREQERHIIKSKKGAYGVKGSTH